MKVIRTELTDLQYTMALNAYLMRSEGGPLTNAFLDWLEPIAHNYHGPAAMPNLPVWIAKLRSVPNNSEKAFSANSTSLIEDYTRSNTRRRF